jgi:bifunctional enzyme CysN/CysC
MREQNQAPLRFPVQRVSRPDQEFRGYAGIVVSGQIRAGDPIVSAVSGKASSVERIVTANGELIEAGAGESVTLCLVDEIDIARGDVLCHPDARPDIADQFAAHVIVMSEAPLVAGRSYLMRIGNQWTPASVTSIRHKVDVNTLNKLAARALHLNDIAVCNFSTATPVAFDSYSENRATGSFILVDRSTNETVAAGMIQFGLRRATNIHVENLMVNKSWRSALMGQKPTLVWFTGLSGSGKSTIAKLLEKRLHDEGRHTYVLDGDNVRHGINRDLGFTEADRVENIRRIGEIAKLFLDAGLIVLCSFISPFRSERDLVRNMVEPGEFMEIFVDAPLEECIRRDPKGLYAKALRGEIPNFTGLDSRYETPGNPDMHLDTANASPDELVADILMRLRDDNRL